MTRIYGLIFGALFAITCSVICVTAQAAVAEGTFASQSEAYSQCMAYAATAHPLTPPYYWDCQFVDRGPASITSPCLGDASQELNGEYAYDVWMEPNHVDAQVSGWYFWCEPVSGYYVVAPEQPLPSGNCGCEGNIGRVEVGEPIEVGTGNVSLTELDYAAGDPRRSFSRTFNSNAATNTAMGIGWRSVFDRHISDIASGLPAGATIASSTYSSPNDACAQGMAYIAANNQKYTGITGSYDGNGGCDLSTGQVIPVLGTGASVGFASSTNPASKGVTVQREDGSQYFFFCSNGTCHSGSNVAIQLTLDSLGYRLTDTDGTIEQYDSNGTLQAITWQDGYQQTLSYASNGLLQTVTDNRGRSLSFGYDSSNLIASVTAPDGTTISYTHDPAGHLTSVTNATGTRTYVYADSANPNALTSLVDENGKTFTSWTYDASGRATGSTHAGGADQTSISYNADGSAVVTDALGAQRTYRFNSFDGTPQVTTISGPYCATCGAGTVNVYDDNGYLEGSQDWNGNVTAYTFDVNGLETQRIDAESSPVERTINATWDATLRHPLERTVLDASGALTAKTDWVYNTRGQALARCEDDPTVSGATSYVCSNNGTAPAGVRRWVYSYCDTVDGSQCPVIGLLLSVDGPRTDVSDVTQYAYYPATDLSGCGTVGGACHNTGDLWKITNALGQTTTINGYDKNGRVTEIADANGVLTDFTYTPRGWLHTRSVSGATTTIDYDNVGNVIKVTQPDGVFTSYTYDDAHRLISITDALGNHIDYTLDAAGNRTAENTYAAGSSTPSRSLSRAYNNVGELVKALDAYSNATSYSYDANGNRTDATDPLGITTHRSYDALNRLAQTIQNYQGTDAATANTTTAFAYDSRDNLTQVTDPDSLNTRYIHDGLSDLGQLQSPDTGTSSYTYDTAGNRISQTDARGVVTTFSYDALNRLTAIGYPTSTLNIHYYYDEPNGTTGCASSYPVGRLTRMTDVSGTTKYCYDSHGNVINKTTTIAALTGTTSFAWNAADRLMGVTYPVGGASVTYTRDADGRIVSIKSGATWIVTAISYLPFGPAKQYTFASGGQVLSKSYDADYRVTDIGGGIALNLHFTLDSMGDITAEGNAAGVPTPNETYHYDPLYRLQQVNDATGAPWQSYSYDKTGDRLSKATANQTPVNTYSYTPNTHHLISISGYDASSRAFDANGNTTALQANGWMYGLGYDDTNRLTLVQQNGTTIETYELNGVGERVLKTPTSGIPTRFVYDQSGHLLFEYGGGFGARAYIWADNTLIAIQDGQSGMHYVYTDHLGAPRAVTATTSSTPIWTWPWVRNPFGEKPASGSGGYTFNLRFPGQYYDSETGLSYNYFRDYEPATGRFPQSDPTGLRGGTNTYAYVGANPMSYSDPFGLWLFPWESPIYVEGGTQEEQQEVMDSVNRVFDTCRGQELLKQIKGSGFKHGQPRQIMLNDQRDDSADHPGPNINLDPLHRPWVNTTKGEIPATLERIIAHEIGHAVTGTEDDGPDRMNNINQNENPIMRDLGQPDRTSYEGG
jgi:RHS repeat-associated protein